MTHRDDPPTAWEQEHLIDPPDFGDSYVLLDDHQALVVELCMICDGPLRECNCYHETEPPEIRDARLRRRRSLDK